MRTYSRSFASSFSWTRPISISASTACSASSARKSKPASSNSSPGEWAKELSASSPKLGTQENQFARDLGQFWEAHHAEAPYRDWELRLLRNLPRVGVVFFRDSGFYPGFILSIKHRGTGEERVLFIEPHGLHHGGLEGNRLKIEALQALERQVSNQPPFKERGIRLGGCLLTNTALESIGDIGDRSWHDLARDENILRQEGPYIERLSKA